MFPHLGIKGASRKVAPSYQKPGPWDGTVTHTYKGVLDIVSKGKWENTQRRVKEVSEMI